VTVRVRACVCVCVNMCARVCTSSLLKFHSDCSPMTAQTDETAARRHQP
jgi:hypothetical protein